VNERWDGDRTGAGVSDGEAFAQPLRTLLDEMARPDWNTEQPEAHLLPHLERWCAREGSPFALRAAAEEDTLFVVDLDTALGTTNEQVRELVYALISTIAEPTTVVVETREDEMDVFDVTLAVTPRQSSFPKGHGHLVRLRVHMD
jgi:hypothetical protein